MVKHEFNLTFMQHIVIIEQIKYMGANDATEDLSHTATAIFLCNFIQHFFDY